MERCSNGGFEDDGNGRVGRVDMPELDGQSQRPVIVSGGVLRKLEEGTRRSGRIFLLDEEDVSRGSGPF